MSGATVYYSVETIANLLEISARQVQSLAKRGIIPKSDNGRYALVPAVQGYLRFLRSRAINGDVASAGGDGDYKARLTRARAEIAEMEAERVRGSLVAVDDVTRVWGEAATNLRARMLALPHKVAPMIAVETDITTCHQVIETEVHGVLSELANVVVRSSGPVSDAASEDAEDVGAAAETDDIPMVGSLPETV